MNIKDKKVFYICGPTASGKTAFSVALAKRIPNAVFINADTMQLYKGLEPLAAHPTTEELVQIDHRLFGILNLDENTSRSEWLKMAVREIQKAFAEGKQPILIGGSRSFAACLAKAAYGIDLPVDQKNAVTFPEENKQLQFPYDLHTILLNPTTDNIHTAILKRIQDNSALALDALRKMRQQGFTPITPGFWTFGVKEFSDVLDGNSTLIEAQQKIAQRTIDYAHEQQSLFAQLKNEVDIKFPGRMVEIPFIDNTSRISQAMEFVGNDRMSVHR